MQAALPLQLSPSCIICQKRKWSVLELLEHLASQISFFPEVLSRLLWFWLALYPHTPLRLPVHCIQEFHAAKQAA